MPPTGRTCPVRVISPVMASFGRQTVSVSTEISAATSVIPAEGPSLGVEPSGTWKWMSDFR